MARQLGGVRGGLTLEKLASYDDLITDALVDKVSRVLAHRANAGRIRLYEGLY
jgi:histone-lysine N-methyltransferase SUV420H